MTEPANSANGAMLSPQATQIETASGRFVDLYDPDPETLDLDDIATALGYTCRYGGHVKRFYSVAEHAELVHDLLYRQGHGPELLKAALFHDAAEAYLGDVVAPLKYAQRAAEFDYPGAIHRASRLEDFKGAYARLSTAMDSAIARRFGIDVELLDCRDLRVADKWALKIEAAALTSSGGAEWRWPGELPHGGQLPPDVRWSGGLDPDSARRRWRRMALAILPRSAGGAR